jgi:putative salt-induced outer membrane protein
MTVEKKSLWEESAAAGLTLTRGNSRTLLFTLNGLATRKTKETELELGADATYGEAFNKSSGQEERNAESLHGFGQYNRLFTERAYGYARIDGLHDGIADVKYRLVLGPGVGYYFLKSDRTSLRGEIGPSFVYEKRGAVTKGYLAARLAERFDHKLNEHAKVWESVEFMPQVDKFENYLVNAEAGVEALLTAKLSLRSFIQDNFVNRPAPGRLKNDVKLVTALAYRF